MFLLYLASSLYLTGLIWFVQIVHYPLFDVVRDSSGVYYRKHSARTSYVVLLPMIIQLACAIWFAFVPDGYDALLMRFLLALVVLLWLSTFLLAVPQHNLLAKGYDGRAVKRLVQTNWIRTVLWSAHSGVLMNMLNQRITG